MKIHPLVFVVIFLSGIAGLIYFSFENSYLKDSHSHLLSEQNFLVLENAYLENKLLALTDTSCTSRISYTHSERGIPEQLYITTYCNSFINFRTINFEQDILELDVVDYETRENGVTPVVNRRFKLSTLITKFDSIVAKESKNHKAFIDIDSLALVFIKDELGVQHKKFQFYQVLLLVNLIETNEAMRQIDFYKKHKLKPYDK